MTIIPSCIICSKSFDDPLIDEFNNDIIILRVGCEKISPKHGRAYFHPDVFDDNEEEKIFHLHCLKTIGFDFSYADDYFNPTNCVFCNDTLKNEVMFCELELGRFTKSAQHIWIPQKDKNRKVRRVYSCWDCVFDNMGEGCVNTARTRLGMEELEQNDEIDYSPISSRKNQ